MSICVVSNQLAHNQLNDWMRNRKAQIHAGQRVFKR